MFHGYILFLGHLGAALYNLESATLHVLEDILDLSPEFKLSAALLRQCNPKKLLLNQKLDKNLRKRVLELCGYPDENDDDDEAREETPEAVSYTHLTLPTIHLV